MARIFNIYFLFNDIMHSAIVSVRSTAFYTEYTLRNFNEDLLELLPGDKILSRSPGEYIFQNASSENSTALMNVIIKAVSEHMHTTQA